MTRGYAVAKADRMNDTVSFVSRGATHVSVATGSRTFNVTFVVLPKYAMLACPSAIKPLQMANLLIGQVLFH